MSKRRDLINELRAYRAGLIEQKEIIDGELSGVEKAIASLNGKPVNAPKTPRAEPGSRQQQVLDVLRENPDKRFGPNDIAEATDMISSTAATAARRLAEADKVELVGETHRGAAIVKHKPTTIKPGYEVVT